jgi:enoyl-[acyl-carrier protein] reductase II
MTFQTPICNLLGIDLPILLAGMGGVSYAEVCAAVSNAGGFGSLGMAGVTPSQLREQMKQVKGLTDKPFGVDLLTAQPESLTQSVDIIIEEGARPLSIS